MKHWIATAVVVASVALCSLLVTRRLTQAIELGRREQVQQQASLETRLMALQRAERALDERISTLSAPACPVQSQRPDSPPAAALAAVPVAPAPAPELDSAGQAASQAIMAAATAKLDAAIA